MFFASYGSLDPKLDINHINGVKSDNRPGNLEQVTASENLKHAYRIGLNTGSGKGSKNKNAKITEGAVLEMFRMKSEGRSVSEIAAKCGVAASNVSHIFAGRAWAHVKPEMIQ